jgi:hypothetical protein
LPAPFYTDPRQKRPEMTRPGRQRGVLFPECSREDRTPPEAADIPRRPLRSQRPQVRLLYRALRKWLDRLLIFSRDWPFQFHSRRVHPQCPGGKSGFPGPSGSVPLDAPWRGRLPGVAGMLIALHSPGGPRKPSARSTGLRSPSPSHVRPPARRSAALFEVSPVTSTKILILYTEWVYAPVE